MKVLKTLTITATVALLSGCVYTPHTNAYVNPAQTPMPERNVPRYSAVHDTHMRDRYWASIEQVYGRQGHMGTYRGQVAPTRNWRNEEPVFRW